MIIPTDKITVIDGETYISVKINKRMLHYLYQFIGKHREDPLETKEKNDIGMMMRGVHTMKAKFNKKDGIVRTVPNHESGKPANVLSKPETDLVSNKPEHVRSTS